MFSGTQWAGTRVWRAAIVALQYVLAQKHLQKKDIINNDNSSTHFWTEKSSILELGCGLGVPGMIMHALTKCHVVLTDKDTLIEQLRSNLDANFGRDSLDQRIIQAHTLDWSTEGVDELLETTGFVQGFDVVLNCDCIFEPLYGDSWKKLVECQEALLRVNPRTYVLTSVERRRFDGIEKYLQALQSSSVVKRVEQLHPDFDAPHEVELYRLYGI
jgi:hypothetical protein